MSTLLFHGTSAARLERILSDRRLRLNHHRKLSLTTERAVAEYFAAKAAHADRDKHLPKGAIIVLDGLKLWTRYDLREFSDPTALGGPGSCNWEMELASLDDIPLEGVLVGVTPLAAERYQDFLEGGDGPFKELPDPDWGDRW
jgi:hypothetical protein